MKKLTLMLAMSAVLTSLMATGIAFASDHDDGETDAKSRSLSLTDVYVFREDKEIAGGSNQHLVFIINTNPRSIPRQQYYFSTLAKYNLHISRVGTSKDVAATTASNITLSLQFGAPDSSNQQAITLTSTVDNTTSTFNAKDGGSPMYTTPLASAAVPVSSDVTINTHTLKVFAGLRKDPFFFDVTSFFRFRAAAAATGGTLPVAGFAAFPTYTPDGVTASDFTQAYNVNTIALRVPIAFLQSSAETVFDVWSSVSIQQ